MRTIPNSVFDEMIAVTQAVREPPGSLKYINGIRRAYLLHKKLVKINDNDSRRTIQRHRPNRAAEVAGKANADPRNAYS
jgi:hypothetical protein